MKNQSIYDDYAITGWPCHFFTEHAKTKYNIKVAYYCQSLPEGAPGLTRTQRLRLWLYTRYLDARDLLMHLKSPKKPKRSQKDHTRKQAKRREP